MNRRISIAEDEPLFFDDEKRGVRYFIRPKSGRTQLRFSTAVDLFGKGSVLDSSDVICMIVDIYVYRREAIDTSKKIADFPDNKKPTETNLIDPNTIIDLYNFILEMNGLSIAEKKSSLQPQTPSSDPKTTEQTTTVTSANTGTGKRTAAGSKRKNS